MGQAVLTARRSTKETRPGQGHHPRKKADTSEQLNDECLKQQIFYLVEKAQTIISFRRNTRNHLSPHSSTA